jgi:hypothetical protein
MTTFWIAILRPQDNEPVLEAVMSPADLGKGPTYHILRSRYNAETRMILLRLPQHTTREQVDTAFHLLTPIERGRLYHKAVSIG